MPFGLFIKMVHAEGDYQALLIILWFLNSSPHSFKGIDNGMGAFCLEDTFCDQDSELRN